MTLETPHPRRVRPAYPSAEDVRHLPRRILLDAWADTSRMTRDCGERRAATRYERIARGPPRGTAVREQSPWPIERRLRRAPRKTHPRGASGRDLPMACLGSRSGSDCRTIARRPAGSVQRGRRLLVCLTIQADATGDLPARFAHRAMERLEGAPGTEHLPDVLLRDAGRKVLRLPLSHLRLDPERNRGVALRTARFPVERRNNLGC